MNNEEIPDEVHQEAEELARKLMHIPNKNKELDPMNKDVAKREENRPEQEEH